MGSEVRTHGKKFQSVVFVLTHAFWPMEQFFILSAKFDCSVASYKLSPLAAASDCEFGFLLQT